jgi:hypothetical protein
MARGERAIKGVNQTAVNFPLDSTDYAPLNAQASSFSRLADSKNMQSARTAAA